MGVCNSTEPRVRALEMLVTALLRALPADARNHALAEAFCLGMGGPSEFHLCAYIRRIALAADEKSPAANDDRKQGQNCRHDDH